MKNIIKNNKGVTLLLSLVIMMSVVAVAIGLSMLIINLYQFSANLDHAYVAYYAAESGMETQLWRIKDGRNNEDPITSVIEAINGDDSNNNDNETLGSGAVWDTSQSTFSLAYLIDSLEQNKSTSFDVSGAHSLKLTWNDNCDSNSWVELGYVVRDDNNLPSTDYNPQRKMIPCDGSTLCPEEDDRAQNLIGAGEDFTVTITPIACDISNLEVKAFDDNEGTGNLINLSNRIYLKSVGRYRDSQIALAASIPYRLPPQGIFNFVLFSEQTIEKK